MGLTENICFGCSFTGNLIKLFCMVTNLDDDGMSANDVGSGTAKIGSVTEVVSIGIPVDVVGSMGMSSILIILGIKYA
uniref:Uncharacterized protein n=1 Tax=Panagrolaimus sp. JU765 TaxID=591449 RepID=A0AC34QU77_9BILA